MLPVFSSVVFEVYLLLKSHYLFFNLRQCEFFGINILLFLVQKWDLQLKSPDKALHARRRSLIVLRKFKGEYLVLGYPNYPKRAAVLEMDLVEVNSGYPQVIDRVKHPHYAFVVISENLPLLAVAHPYEVRVASDGAVDVGQD